MPAGNDRGAAAVEFAIVLGVLLAFLGFIVPVGFALHQKVELERAAGEVVRFASNANGPTEAPLPTTRDVQSAAVAAYHGASAVTAGAPVLTSDSTCPRGQRVEVTLTSTADLGPFSGLLAALPGVPSSFTLTASASNCRE